MHADQFIQILEEDTRRGRPSRSALGRRKLLPKNVLQRKVNVLSSPRFTDLTDYLATRNKKPIQEEDESE
jgi:hypothetical protein